MLSIYNQLDEEIKKMKELKTEYVNSPFFKGYANLANALKRFDAEADLVKKMDNILRLEYEEALLETVKEFDTRKAIEKEVDDYTESILDGEQKVLSVQREVLDREQEMDRIAQPEPMPDVNHAEVPKEVEKKIKEEFASDPKTLTDKDIEVNGDEVTTTIRIPETKERLVWATETAKHIISQKAPKFKIDLTKPIKYNDIEVYNGVAFVGPKSIFL